MYIKILNITFLILWLSGCSHNVHFFDQYNEEPKYPTTNNTVKLYIDAFGSLYPDMGYPKKFIPSDDEKISQGLFTQTEKDQRICASAPPTSDAYLLCESVKDTDKPLTQWRKAQKILWNKAAANITKTYLKNSHTDLVFLIHGFNNYESEGHSAFTAIKAEVEDIIGTRKPLYVEVYWDGFKGKFTGAWRKAQASGPLVGFKLRQLFQGLDEQYHKHKQSLPPVQMITHSSGAFIVGALLGDPISAQPDLQDPPEDASEYKLFHKNRGAGSTDYPIPDFPSIRVGFIAAATATNTYSGDKEYPSTGLLAKNTTMIFTMNYRDIGLSKLFRIHNFSSFGATGAGADRELYCRDLDTLNNNDIATEVYAFDFRDHDAPFYKTYDGHGVESYFLLKEQTDLFMKKIFDLEYQDGEKYIDFCP
ncbi:hypothetical protein ACPUVO_03850 [Pseudocolwellia sp. HL-MZ19]|uniref:hypothetical protein n=1 Tax=Pseudocolwellia sp. HL-MZ19 TaxID=3400846 RepID=UPI003CEF67B4